MKPHGPVRVDRMLCGMHTDPILLYPLVLWLDERLGPDLSRGRSRSIGGDLDIAEEGFEQTIVTLQSLHHGSIGYQHVHTQIGLIKKDKFLSMQPKIQARKRKNATKLTDECIAYECEVLQTVERQNCSWEIYLSKIQTLMVRQLLNLKALGTCRYALDATLMGYTWYMVHRTKTAVQHQDRV
jgi:hypothetical protein